MQTLGGAVGSVVNEVSKPPYAVDVGINRRVGHVSDQQIFGAPPRDRASTFLVRSRRCFAFVEVTEKVRLQNDHENKNRKSF